MLIDKIEAWGGATKGISRKEAETASISTLGRSIRYPLAATAMDEIQCHKEDKRLRSNVLCKMGVVRTAPD